MKRKRLRRGAGRGDATGAGSEAETGQESKLIELGREFVELEGQLAQLEEQARAVSAADWTPARERVWLAKADAIRQRMFEIAVEIVSMPAKTVAGLQVKARALLDLVHGDPEDVTHHLAVSLSRDILELPDNDQASRVR